MPTTIEIPGHGEVDFPDSMSDADIQAAVSRLAGKGGTQPPQPPGRDQPMAYLGAMLSNVPHSAGQAVEGSLNGIGQLIAHPIDTATGAIPAIASHYVDRYGSPEARERTVRDDPVGMVMDMLPVRALLNAPAAARSMARGAKSVAAKAAETVAKYPKSTSAVVGAVPGALAGSVGGAVSGAAAGVASAPAVASQAQRIANVLRGESSAARASSAVPTPMLDALMRGASFDELAALVPPEVQARATAAAATAKAAMPAAPVPRVARRRATPAASPAPSAPPVEAPPVAAAPATPAAPRTAAAASPAAPTPLPVKVLEGETLNLPAAARTRGQMSPASIQNDLGLVARRAGVTLAPEQFAEAESLVRAGQSPIEAVSSLAAKPPAPAAAAAVPKSLPKRMNPTPDELQEYVRLVATGKTHDEAVQALVAARKLAGSLKGTRTPAQARATVAERNATGKWPDGTP